MPSKPTPAAPVSPAAQKLAPPKFRLVDGVMIALALVSVAIVLLDIFARHLLYAWNLFGAAILVDLVIAAIFAADFLLESRGQKPARVLRERWFDLVGLVPMAAFVVIEALGSGVPVVPALTGEAELRGAAAAGGLLRLFRLVRIVRIVQAFSRFLRATNMTLGEQVAKQFFDKYRRIIVAELTTPIMVAGITVTQEIVIRMKFLESAGKAIDAKRPEIHAAVLEALERNHVPESVLARPIVDKIIHDVENTVVNTVVDTLTGPELNKLTQEMIVEIMENFKKQLESPEGKALLRNMGQAPPAPAAEPPAPASSAALR